MRPVTSQPKGSLAASRASPPRALEKVLLSRVGEELYGIALEGLRQVLSTEGLREVPGSATCRALTAAGQTFPVIELSELFGFAPSTDQAEQRVVLIEGQGRLLGLLVDAVEEVGDLDPAAVVPFPGEVTELDPRTFRGLVRRGDRIVVLLNPDALTTLEEVQLFYREHA